MADYQEGEILTNPDTGDRVQLQQGKWTSIGPTVGEDIKRATIPEAVRGVVGAATLPHTATDLVKKGVAWGTEKLGFEDTANRMRADIANPPGWKIPGTEMKLQPGPMGFMVSPETVMSQIEKMSGGPLYSPQTTPGKYYGAAVQSIPAMFGGGGVANTAKNAVKTVAGALGGEAAGQATEDKWWSPIARMAGTLAGGQVPSAGRRIATPMPADPAHLARAQNVESEGVKLGSGQFTGYPRWNQLETPFRNSPYGESRGMSDPAQEASVSRALNRSTGGPDVLPTSPIVETQRRALASEQNMLAHDPTVQMPIDQPLRRDLSEVDRSHRLATGAPVYGRLGPNTDVDPLVGRVAGAGPWANPVIGSNAGLAGGPYSSAGGTRTGANWLNMRNDFSRRAASGGAAPEMQDAYGGLLRAIDAAMARSHPEFGRIAGQMENADALARTVGAPGPQAAKGIANPSTFYQAHTNQAGNPTAQFARDVEAVRTPPAADVTHGKWPTLAGAGAGILYAKYGHPLPGMDPAIFGLLAGPAAAGVAQGIGTPRVVLNDLTQKWLRNQRFRPSGESPGGKLSRAGRINLGNSNFRDATEPPE